MDITFSRRSVAEYVLPQVTGRRIEMFLLYQRYYTYGDDSSKVPAGTTVELGKNLYIAIGYDAGSRAPVGTHMNI